MKLGRISRRAIGIQGLLDVRRRKGPAWLPLVPMSRMIAAFRCVHREEHTARAGDKEQVKASERERETGNEIENQGKSRAETAAAATCSVCVCVCVCQLHQGCKDAKQT